MTMEADSDGPDASAVITFRSRHATGLLAESYKVEFTQTLERRDDAGLPPMAPEVDPSTDNRKILKIGNDLCTPFEFRIEAPRLALQPNDIAAVFPPAGGSGHYSNVLPHLVLASSTLPWQRTAMSGGDPDTAPPWLALLVIDEADEADLRHDPAAGRLGTLSVARTKLANRSDCWVPDPLAAAASEDDGPETVQVVDIRTSRIAKTVDGPPGLLPAKTQTLAKLAHVRIRAVVDARQTAREVAVVVAGRPPREGVRNTVHLVSVEGLYNEKGAIRTGGREYCRLLCLKSWQFHADKEQGGSFKAIAANLGDQVGMLRLPDTGEPSADRGLAAGMVPMAHLLADGSQTISWYRGPLLPGAPSPSDEEKAAIRAADLWRRDSKLDILDAALAAAWELGRGLAAQDSSFSRTMSVWHRAHLPDDPHLPIDHLPTHPVPDPPFPAAWFEDLMYLRRIPFRYLVAAEKMLPMESLRFFQLDPRWIGAAMRGAAAIGAFEGMGDGASSLLLDKLPAVPAGASGAILRSRLLDGWPGLHIYGLDRAGGRVREVSRIEPAPGIVLLLFFGPIHSLELGLPPEHLHFTLQGVGTTFDQILGEAQEAIAAQPNSAALAATLCSEAEVVRFHLPPELS